MKRREDIWTEDQLSQLEKLWIEPGAKASDIGKQLGRTAGAILAATRFRRDRFPKLKDLKNARVADYYKRGLSRKRVAEIEKIKVKSVGRLCIAAGLEPPQPKKSGPKPGSKSNPPSHAFTDIDGLRALAAEGKSISQISTAMGFGTETIRRHAKANGIKISLSPAIANRFRKNGTIPGRGYYLRCTSGKFLDLGGIGLTSDKNYAYKANYGQAETMMRITEFDVVMIPETSVGLGRPRV